MSTPHFCCGVPLLSVCDLRTVYHRPRDHSQRIGSRGVSAFSLLPRNWMGPGVPALCALWVSLSSLELISEYIIQNVIVSYQAM